MSVSLAEIVAAARRGDVSFVAESAGYIVLGLADSALRSFRHASLALDGWTARLDEQGDVAAGTDPRLESESAQERSLRELLHALLAVVRTPSPNLLRVASREDPTGLVHLVVELEAALVPVNRKAARRSLARLCRETLRALDRSDIIPVPLTALGRRPSPAASPPTPWGGTLPVSSPPAISIASSADEHELAIDIVVVEEEAEPDFTALLSPVAPPAGEAARSPSLVKEPAPPLFMEDTPSPILEAARPSPGCDVPELPSPELPVPPVRVSWGDEPPQYAFDPDLECSSDAGPQEDAEREETPTRLFAPVVLEDEHRSHPQTDANGPATSGTTAERGEKSGGDGPRLEEAVDDAAFFAEDEPPSGGRATKDLFFAKNEPSVTTQEFVSEIAQPRAGGCPDVAFDDVTELTATYVPSSEADVLPWPAADAREEQVVAESLAAFVAPQANEGAVESSWPVVEARGEHVEAESGPTAAEDIFVPVEPAPSYPRLSRLRPSDIAELLARHGAARHTDDSELLEGLSRLAERESQLG